MTAQLNLTIKSEEDTRQLAFLMSGLLGAGDIILLNGDLGAGKSFFARAVLRALAVDTELEVPSPTFSLVQPYRFGELHCVHADLYRLSDESEAEELGLFDDHNLMLIEWPNRLPELADKSKFSIEFLNIKGQPEARNVAVVASEVDAKQLAATLESGSTISFSI